PPMASGTGLRERKKQQTRQLIFENAARLFAERGFDGASVAEVARSSDVSEMTVFNYFPTKEDLFFGGVEFFEERLLESVRARPEGVSVVRAFRDVVLDGIPRLAEAKNTVVIAKVAAMIGASRALRLREREIVAGYTERLAELLADET